MGVVAPSVAAETLLPSALIDRFRIFASTLGNRPFLRLLRIDEAPLELTYDGLMVEATRWWQAYEVMGVPPGGRIAIILPHSVDLYAASIGAMLARRVPAILAPPSSKLRVAEFERMAEAQYAGLDVDLSVAAPSLAGVVERVSCRPTLTPNDVVFGPAPELAELPSGLAPSMPAIIQYSSGTTGRKKGVVISGHALLGQVDEYAKAIGIGPGDAVVSWLPLYHDMGLIACLMLPLLRGVPVTAMSPFDWISRPAALLDAVSDYRPTLMWLPNFGYHVLARTSLPRTRGDWDLSSLRAIVNCSEPVRASAHEALFQALSGYGLDRDVFKTCYAMAETTFAVTSGGFDRPLAHAAVDFASLAEGRPVAPGTGTLVSSGTPLADTRVWIGSPVEPLPDRHLGEIWVESPSLASGYLQRPDMTAAAFVGGCYRTFDLGFLDSGELYVIGRKDDVIVTGGRNIQAEDVEEIVGSVDGVIPGRVAAFGMEHPGDGTRYLAVIAESNRKKAAARDDLARAIALALLRVLDLAPREVRVVDPGWLKKSTAGKLSRRAIRDAYLIEFATKRQPVATINADDRRSAIRALVSSLAGNAAVDDGAPLFSSGLLDSFALTELLVALEEHFDLPIPSPNIVGLSRIDTIEAIEHLIEETARGMIAKLPISATEARKHKTRDYLAGPRDADFLIVGSSTAFFFRTGHARQFGYRAFNFAVNSADPIDVFCIARFVGESTRLPLRRLLVAVDIFQFRVQGELSVELRLADQPELARHLLAEEREWLARNHDRIDKENAASRLFRQRLGEWSPQFWYAFDPITGDVIDLDRPMSDQDLPRRTANPAAKNHELEMAMRAFTAICPRRAAYVSALVDFARSTGIALDFILMPIHAAASTHLSSQTDYERWGDAVRTLLHDAAGSMARIHDFRAVERFGGDPDDFSDGYHPGPNNTGRMLEAVLGS